MKHIISAVIFVLLAITTSIAQENIFVQKEGRIYTKSKYIDSLAVADMNIANPFNPVVNAKATTLKGQNTQYQIRLSKFSGEYPGDFQVIQVYQANKKLLEVTNADGWTSMPSNIPSPNGYFFQVNLNAYTAALFFFSQPKDNYPQDLTIVVLRTGKAYLVYNKPCVLQSISKNSYSIQLEMDDSYPVHFAPAGTTSNSQKIAESQESTIVEQPLSAQSDDKNISKKKKKKKGKKGKKSLQIPIVPIDSSVVIVKRPVIKNKIEPISPKRHLLWSENGILKIKEI